MQPYKTLPQIMINLNMSTGVCGEVNQDLLSGRTHVALCKLNTCPTLTKKEMANANHCTFTFFFSLSLSLERNILGL